MTWPTGILDITNMDQDSDSPLTARGDIRSMADFVNQMLAAAVVTQDTAAIYGGTAGGTANALTGAQSPAPASLTNGKIVALRAAAANTAAATFNLNGLGAVAIKKHAGAALVAGDIAGAGHILLLLYSTVTATWLLLNPSESTATGVTAGSYTNANVTVNAAGRVTGASSGSTTVGEGQILSSSVSQTKLKTASGIVSRTALGQDRYTLPGGAYGFYPQTMTQRASGNDSPRAMYWIGGNYLDGNTGYTPDYPATFMALAEWDSYVSYISMTLYTRTYADTYMNAQQRYVTASAPYNLGDGDVPLFVFAKVDSNGDTESIYICEAPPWAYNGPTSIKPDVVLDGQAFQDVTLFDPRDAQGDEAAIVTAFLNQSRNKAKRAWSPDMPDPVKVRIPLDHRIKNADMDIIPHPFADEPGKTIVLVDPLSPLVERIKTLHDAGENAVDVVNAWLNIDNTALNRKGPKGVMQVSAAFKNTRRTFA